MTETTDSDRTSCRTLAHASDPSGETPRHNPHTDTHVSAGSLVGYARVSDRSQRLDRQLDILAEAGCERVFEDHGVSGTRMSRPGLDACLAFLRPGDTLVIQSLDRLGRRTVGVLQLIDDLSERGVALRILNLGISTDSALGAVLVSVAAAFAQMERDVLVERTRQGLESSRARGRVGGRPRVLTEEQVRVAADWRAAGKSWTEIGRLLGVSERTIRRRVGGQAA
ncbi:recombinase family protein [Nocardioides sp. NPDC092400]|uniref:recombinase family protein n=1 Tax=Nocardioides sp. NPDC092400 TaxID=3155196 RepID=UPI0034256B1A